MEEVRQQAKGLMPLFAQCVANAIRLLSSEEKARITTEVTRAEETCCAGRLWCTRQHRIELRLLTLISKTASLVTLFLLWIPWQSGARAGNARPRELSTISAEGRCL
jgi:hypothetical protein